MSTPVMSSVTGCSTWMRVFISRKKTPRGSEKELDRSCSDVVDGFRCCNSGLAHRFTERLGHRGTGCFFEHFLVPSLNAAFTFTQVDGSTVLVGKHLDFNVLDPESKRSM